MKTKSWTMVCGEETKHFLIGVFGTVLGFILATLIIPGCDGTAAERVDDGGSDAGVHDAGKAQQGDVGSGLLTWSDGTRYCDVPSPAGDAVNRATGRTARQDVMRELEDKSFLAFVVVKEFPNPVMSVASMCKSLFGTCSDAAHDHASPSGEKHCLDVGCEISGSNCMVGGLFAIDESAGKPRATAACFADGRFAGWWCNNNS